MESIDFKEHQARFICVEFLLLHDAIKKKKGLLDKMARIVFNSNNKNGRDPRLSQAKTNVEFFLGEPVCNISKLPRFGTLSLQDINQKIKQEGVFLNSITNVELDTALRAIEQYLEKSTWKPWKGDALFGFKEDFKSSSDLWKNWEGLSFRGLSNEALKKVGTEQFDAFYVSAIYNNKELDSKFKAIFKISSALKKVVWEYYELLSENQSWLISSSTGKITEEDKVAHFLFDDKHTRLISIAKGNIDWVSASPFLYGTYSWTEADGPTVGKIFLKQADSYEAAKANIGARTESVVQTSLLYKKITAGNNIVYDITEFSGYHEIQKIKELQGEYRGYYLSHHQSQLLFECRLLIEESGKVSFWENRADAEPSHGVARFLDNVFMIRLNYEPSIDFFRSFINLKRSYLDASSEVLQGTFGFPMDIDLPQSGRIFFYKSDSRQSQPDLFSTPPPKAPLSPLEVIRLRDKTNVESFLKKVPLAKEIIRFLQGLASDRMSDDPFLCFWGTDLDIRKASTHSMGNAYSQLGLSAIEPPEHWVGTYEFYLFQHHLSPTGFRLECMKMDISKEGLINFSAKNSDYTGVIFKSKNKGKALLAAISKEDSTQQDVFLCFQEMKTNQDQSYTLFGTYAGFGQVSELQPTGGRFIAYKTTDAISPEEFDIKDEDSRKKITAKRPNIFDYFLGYTDSIVGSYRMYNELNLVPKPNLQAKNEVERLKGCYRLLKLTSTMNKIADALLVIQGDGRVQLTSIDGKMYHGVINIFFGMMAFNFHHLDNDDTFALTLFAKAEKAMEVGDYLVGLHMSKILDKPQAYCARSILKKISDNPYEASSIRNPITLFQIPTSKSSEEYSIFERGNKEYNNGLNYLTGPENNYIRGPHGQSPDYFYKTQRFEKRFDHGLSLFLTARYLSGSYNYGDLASKYWEAALQNGFSNGPLIAEFKKELNNSNIYKSDVDRLIQMINSATPFVLPPNQNNEPKFLPSLKPDSNVSDDSYRE